MSLGYGSSNSEFPVASHLISPFHYHFDSTVFGHLKDQRFSLLFGSIQPLGLIVKFNNRNIHRICVEFLASPNLFLIFFLFSYPYPISLIPFTYPCFFLIDLTTCPYHFLVPYTRCLTKCPSGHFDLYPSLLKPMHSSFRLPYL